MNRPKRIILTLLLALPILAFIIHHYTAHSRELHPTGFTVDENVLYMSYAHQYLDQSSFSLGYSNPFSGDPQSPKIYFQPATLLLAGVLKTGADPGLSFTLFGLLMAIACIYMGIKILEHLLPGNKYLVLICVLFTWGGGLSALAGIGAGLYTGMPLHAWRDAIYIADPANGWWGLNWGRTLFIPLEAFYHFLFLLNIYWILKQKWKAALITAALLSISHPFTGVEYLLIICGWAGLERVVIKDKYIPAWFFTGNIILLMLHVGYYLFFLQQFEEHRQLFSQYRARWTYSFRVFIPAYALVIALCIWAARVKKGWAVLLSNPIQRLFLCWAIIAFLLSKHEWFIPAMQPIHFTRGYIWAGAFLLALPGLVVLLNSNKRNIFQRIVRVFFIGLLLLDNTFWVYNQLREKATVEWEGHITQDTKDVFNYLHTHTRPDDLLIGNAQLVNYMANVYSPANAWVSHPYNTPMIYDRDDRMDHYLGTGEKPAEWKSRRIMLIVDKRLPEMKISPLLQGEKIWENTTYTIILPHK
ncbi:MAG: hypothetical protein NTW29_08860 [Bacteroidetes bacterium]|nr:hypothetical protein [Bacteroidota bacterium]